MKDPNKCGCGKTKDIKDHLIVGPTGIEVTKPLCKKCRSQVDMMVTINALNEKSSPEQRKLYTAKGKGNFAGLIEVLSNIGDRAK